jgi:hypothetical protein
MPLDATDQELVTGETTPADHEHHLYSIEAFLRQSGDYKVMLAVDTLVLNNDISAAQKAAQLQTIIQGVLNGKR